MHVRKFEADTLDEALKQIKKELGPDAIILKTVTNKGLKGAFKKKKIEITAAISEKTYTKKAQVDVVLQGEQKEKFYKQPASVVANMIDEYAEPGGKNQSATPKIKSYGSLGLNKQVNTVKEFGSKIKNGLDDFLKLGTDDGTHDQKTPVNDIEATLEKDLSRSPSSPRKMTAAVPKKDKADYSEAAGDYDHQHYQSKIDELERRIFEINKRVEKIDKQEPSGLYQLRTILRSLGINESYIQHLIQKLPFELSEQDLESSEVVFDVALNHMMKGIKVAMPLFSAADTKPVVTVLLSETSCGQTSMMLKLGSLKKDSVLIKSAFGTRKEEDKSGFVEKWFGLQVIRVNTVAEIASECRKAIEAGKSVFIDYKNKSVEFNETKKFIDGLKRSFEKVEVLISLSSVHSEMYNRKILSLYKGISDGLVVSHLDLCLDFGALFNLAESYELPFKFYGTGEVVPDDVEAATAERILAGIFQLK